MARVVNRNFLNSTNIIARYKYILFIFVITCTCFFYIAYVYNQIRTPSKNSIFSLYMKGEEKVYYEKQYTIKTEGCIIPGMNPFDDSIKKFVEYPKTMKKCNDHGFSIVEHNKTHIWINKKKVMSKYNLNTDNKKFRCCYSAFFRPKFIKDIHSPKVDDRIEYQNCTYFFEVVEVKNEFVRVICNFEQHLISDDFFVFAVKKDNDKIEILRNKTAYNILIMGIDAVSRLNLYRTMPKTLAYLKTKGAIDLSGYNKVGDNSFPNIIPMLLGIAHEELRYTCLPYNKARFDNCPFIWEYFKQAGYYTALGEDSSSLGTFNYNRGGFVDTPTDYYLHTFINEAEKRGGNNRDFNSYLCLSNKYFYKILLNYIENLTSTLNSSKLFGFFWEITMSHDYLNYPMVMDTDYVDLFERLDKSNFLKNTILFLVSDHGIRYGGIRFTKQGYLEERLPFVFALVPPSFQETYTEAYNNFKLNSERLTTPFDIYETLSDLINLDNIVNKKIKSRKTMSYAGNRGISLFLPIPSNRTCKMAGIKDHWCTCQRDTNIPKDSAYAVASSNYLLKHLNKILSKYIKCASLKLIEILEATEKIVGDSKRYKIGYREFMIVVHTKPGNGVFEGTVRLIDGINGTWSTAGEISRLNLYGNQSHCVDDPVIKLYCYCLNKITEEVFEK